MNEKQKHCRTKNSTNSTVYNGIMLHLCINVYQQCYVCYLFIVMASSSNPSPSEDDTSGTDLSVIHTEDEEQIDTTDWIPAKCKKLQHMVEFHEEYQHVFGEKSIHTIMKNRITHMNPPMHDSVCQEEMQNATPDNDVIIEYIMDAQGRKVKKLKPLLLHLNLTENIPITYIVMITYQKYLRTILHRKEK